MSTIKKNTRVRKVVPDIVGTVVDARVDAELAMEYLVAYTSADGNEHQRWFSAAELQPDLGDDQQ